MKDVVDSSLKEKKVLDIELNDKENLLKSNEKALEELNKNCPGSQEELFNLLSGAFNVKLRLINKEYNYIKKIDIWNYLKINKWCKAKNLTLSEMVNDIIEIDITKVDLFLKDHLKRENKNIVD